MKTLLLIGALVAVAGMAMTGCDRLWDARPVEDNPGLQAAYDRGRVKTIGLYVDSTTTMGRARIWNDFSHLYVRVMSPGVIGWYLRKTRIAVATSLEGIPHDGQGRPVPASFPYKAVHHPREYVHAYTVEIPLNDWRFGTMLYVAVEEELIRPVDNMTVSTWAGRRRLPGEDYAAYTTYTLWEYPAPPLD